VPDQSVTSAVGIVGGGLMGSGIAECMARAQIATVVYEPSADALEAARGRVEGSLARGVRSGKMTSDEAADALLEITFTNQIEDLAPVDFAIEAVTEELELKASIFSQLDRVLAADAVIASNTSSIPIALLASATSRPELVLGLHFFSPVPMMDLVEIVVGLDTAEATTERAVALTLAIGKEPIRTKDRSGFIVNTLLVPYLMAAVRMYEDAFASREDIDKGMQLGCGHPMGPLALCDLIGLDVLYAICDSLYEEFKRPEYAPPPLLKRMVAAGRLGRKTGQGFYEYDQSKKKVAA